MKANKLETELSEDWIMIAVFFCLTACSESVGLLQQWCDQGVVMVMRAAGRAYPDGG